MDVKIILLCSSRLALPALQELAFFRMLAAVVIPRHCDEMLENVQFVLSGSGIPIIAVDKPSYADAIRNAIEHYQPTLGLIITFSYKIPAAVYALPKRGFYNIHPGSLPEYRGADPVFWQIKNGEKQAGVTVHQLDAGWDTGPVVLKELIQLEETDTYGLLTTKLSLLAARLAIALIKLTGLDPAVPARQQEASKARYFKKQTATDVTINWDVMDARAIIALINACNPWNKGAITKVNNKIVRLLEAALLPETIAAENMLPGTIIAMDQRGLFVATLHRQIIVVHTVYVEEGFMHAARLQQLGVRLHDRFEMI